MGSLCLLYVGGGDRSKTTKKNPPPTTSHKTIEKEKKAANKKIHSKEKTHKTNFWKEPVPNGNKRGNCLAARWFVRTSEGKKRRT